MVFDEATGVQSPIWDAAKACIVGNADRWIVAGNPTDPTSAFHEACAGSRGTWEVIELNSENHPNVLEGRELVPGAVTREWIAECEEEYGGRDTDLYRMRVLGQWPTGGTDVMIPLSVIEASMRRWVKPTNPLDILGIDVARFGDDETVLAPFHRDHRKSLDYIVNPLIARRGQDTQATAGQAKALGPRLVATDDQGIGGGVTDRLREEGVPVHPETDGKAREDHKFADRRTERWWYAGQALATWLALPPGDRRLEADLASPKFKYDGRGRKLMEKKAETKKRLKRSPDRADAVVVGTCAVSRFEGSGFLVGERDEATGSEIVH
jgi:hypothetical protein